MQICVLSGKGGAGKTFVATNLFAVADHGSYIDCDVEEPNGHIFFHDTDPQSQPVTKLIPQIDPETCTLCNACVDFCKFKSLVNILDSIMFFDDMCHSCGGCAYVCPNHAITEVPFHVGEIYKSTYKEKSVYTGTLDIAQASGSAIISQLIAQASTEELAIVDCPPGSDCSVMDSISDADFCLVVVEPTIFGAHNMKMVVELLQIFHKPFGVVFNKGFEDSYPELERYIQQHNGHVLGSIPFSEKAAKASSEGLLASEEDFEMADFFKDLLKKVIMWAAKNN